MASPKKSRQKEDLVLHIPAKDRRELEKTFSGRKERLDRKELNLTPEQLKLSNRLTKLRERIDKSTEAVINDNKFAQLLTKSESNSGFIDPLLQLAHKELESSAGNKRTTKKDNAQLAKAKEEIVAANKSGATAIIEHNRKKVAEAIATYNLILRIVPKMRLALTTFADSIISPDDYSRTTLNVVIENDFKAHKEEYQELQTRVEDLIERYNLNKYLKKDILTYLKNGRMYYLVMSMNKQIKRYLSLEESADLTDVNISHYLHEHENLPNYGYKVLKQRTLSESTKQVLVGSEGNVKVLQEGISGSLSSAIGTPDEVSSLTKLSEAFGLLNENHEVNGIVLSEASARIDDFIAENFLIGTSDNIVFEEATEIAMADRPLAAAFSPNGEVDQVDKRLKTIPGRERAILRRVSAANIVKLEHNEVCYGYLMLDIVDLDGEDNPIPSDKGCGNDDDISFSATAQQVQGAGRYLQSVIAKDLPKNGQRGNQGDVTKDSTAAASSGNDPRLEFIADVFANRLSLDTNIKLLRRNAVLKTAIYNSLALKDLRNKNEKLRIVYLEPEEVVELDRGQSIFDNILFFAKIYISALLTALMQNILNGSPKRAIYVEVGLDNDPSGSIQQTIRDVKSKDVVGVHKMDLQSILNFVGEAQTYYIPVVDGDKPISFETIDALDNKSLDDDFLKWLSDNMFSGINTPSAYLNDVENVDFARTLAMQHSRYLRETMVEQTILNPGFTELVRRLYRLEYLENESNRSSDLRQGEKTNANSLTFDSEAFSIQFPTPNGLKLNNLNDQISNAGGTVSNILENTFLDVTDENRDKAERIFKDKLLRALLPNFDWSMIDEVKTSTKQELTDAETRTKLADAQTNTISEVEGGSEAGDDAY